MATEPTPAETQQSAAEGFLDSKLPEIMAAVEAILFAAGYPVAYRKLAEVIGLPEGDLRILLSHMAEGYDTRGIQLLLFPDSCQLCTKETYAPYVREALGIRRGGNLSASSMEVLAVIAYNQPVTRAYVDTIRGVDSSYAVSSLLDKGLIEATGRLEAPGRPMLYGTTDKFLRVFGLNHLSELPETQSLTPPDQPVADGEALCDGADGDTDNQAPPEGNTAGLPETPPTDASAGQDGAGDGQGGEPSGTV